MTQLLDHGYIELIETWGSDERIIEAARMSTDKGFKGWGPIHEKACPARAPNATDNAFHAGPCLCEHNGGNPGDEKLLKYLWDHKHATPFEMAGMTIEVQAPIFVFREWHRHRTQSYNELSARYTPLPNVNYVPSDTRIHLTSGKNKQAQGVVELDSDRIFAWENALRSAYEKAQEAYQFGLDIGIPKELARISVPVGRYSRMRASANLRNWLAFLTLRMDPAAQWEIRQYANEVAKLVEQHFPRTYQLFAAEGKS